MKSLVAIVAVWMISGGPAIAAEPPGTLLAGVVKKDITPTKPVAMAAYSRKSLSRGVHDPLSVRAIAFQQDGKRLVLVATDLIGFHGEISESMRKAVLAACQLQPSDLFLTANHTHSGPSLTLDPEKGHAHNVEYTKTLETQLVECVRESLAQMTPAQLGVGVGWSPVGVNRRASWVDGVGRKRIELGRNPHGPTDKEVQVLKVSQGGTGKLLSVVFAYATHSTAMGPANFQITGDVLGLTEQFVEKYLGQGVIVPGFAGASGDINPWIGARVTMKSTFDTDNGWIPEAVLMGAMLGEEVASISNRISGAETNCPIKTAIKTFSLPGKPREPAPAADVPLTITVGRVGDVAVIGLGAEVFHEIGRAIKDASPFKHTFVVTHCNGSAGYLPTRSSYDEGGYEVQSSRFGPEAAEQVVAKAVEMLRDLQ